MKKRVSLLLACITLLTTAITGCTAVTFDPDHLKYTYDAAVANLTKLHAEVERDIDGDPEDYDNENNGFWYAETDTSKLLPDFLTGRQALVTANREDFMTAIVVSSPEKASTVNPSDRWMIDVVQKYNSKRDRKGSITLYGGNSGEMYDYIRSGKYIPDAWTPSTEPWGANLGLTPYVQRLAGNVAGIVSKDGASPEEVISEVEADTIAFGYTNPNLSSTGWNFLYRFIHVWRDASSFINFQRNIKLVSYTTPQMRNAALSGKLDAFVYESQQFVTGEIEVGGRKTTLADMYKFVPYARHDNPYYILNESKRELLEDFANFCLTPEMQKLATKYGFNQYDDFIDTVKMENTIDSDLRQYKEEKTGGRPIVSILVCDVSDSMNGEPLYQLKKSLRGCAGVISPNNYISLVTFATTVKVELPIAQFDDTMCNRFLNAVDNMATRGSTAMFSAAVVAEQLIVDHKAANPNLDAIYRIYFLSDGDPRTGLSREITFDTLKCLGIPIYCFSYNGGSKHLEDMSMLNEAACVAVTDENVEYVLANFFKAEM